MTRMLLDSHLQIGSREATFQSEYPHLTHLRINLDVSSYAMYHFVKNGSRPKVHSILIYEFMKVIIPSSVSTKGVVLHSRILSTLFVTR